VSAAYWSQSQRPPISISCRECAQFSAAIHPKLKIVEESSARVTITRYSVAANSRRPG
jgi:hypothetical protein